MPFKAQTCRWEMQKEEIETKGEEEKERKMGSKKGRGAKPQYLAKYPL